MRIAIIDDVASEREDLRRRLNVWLTCRGLNANLFEYENGSGFLAAAGEDRFDLAFLDIYLAGENGIDTARQLRRFDSDCLLVFVTTSADFALEGFRVRAMQYLVKPYSDGDLFAVCDEAASRLPASEPYIEVSSSGGTVRLRFSQILYAEHYQHLIHIYTTDKRDIATRQTFRDFTTALSDERFFLCRRGVIINLEHVKDFDGTAFLLENEVQVPVSRDLTRAARIAFGDYLFRGGSGI